MQQRFKMREAQPGAYAIFYRMEEYLSKSKLTKAHWVLVKIRASQINGCAFCLHMHVEEAIALGENVQRLMLLSAWRESTSLFNEAEQAVLALTEAITKIGDRGLGDREYDDCIRLFGEEYTSLLFLAVCSINSWNRIGRSLNMLPGEPVAGDAQSAIRSHT